MTTFSKPTFAKESISEESARRMIAAAIAKARELGAPQVIAVLDEGGVLKAFARMDGAPLASVDAARQKAYTALFGLPSGDLARVALADDTLRASLPHVPGMLLLGGGLPIVASGSIAGAVGVGGGTVEQDIATATAALAALET
jgi:uncharacterized protein GlcG (DUF336 family)